MSARLLYHYKRRFDDGAILEVRAWELAKPVAGSAHSFKYRLFYGFSGKRLIGYDNERGKGDHRHVGRREERYAFVSLDRLLDDFFADIDSVRKQ
jgi:hypothetical protein